MATATLPQIPQSGGIDQIARLFQVLAPSFGSGQETKSTESSGGTTSNTATTSSSPEANEQLNQMIEKIFKDVNPEDIDSMVGNILERAKQTFGAQSGIGSNAAGVRAYSDTTRQSLQKEAMARAVGEASAAKLNALNAANKQAAELVTAKLQSNRTQTSTTTAPKTTAVTTAKQAASPAAKGLSVLGVGAFAYNLLKKKGVLDKESEAGVASGAQTSGGNFDETGDQSFASGGGSGDAGAAIDSESFNAARSIDEASLDTGVVDGTDQLAELIDSTVIPSAADGTQVADAGTTMTDVSGGLGLADTGVVISDPSSMSQILASQNIATGSAMPASTLPMGMVVSLFRCPLLVE
jgi:hypothetical protein